MHTVHQCRGTDPAAHPTKPANSRAFSNRMGGASAALSHHGSTLRPAKPRRRFSFAIEPARISDAWPLRIARQARSTALQITHRACWCPVRRSRCMRLDPAGQPGWFGLLIQPAAWTSTGGTTGEPRCHSWWLTKPSRFHRAEIIRLRRARGYVSTEPADLKTPASFRGTCTSA